MHEALLNETVLNDYLAASLLCGWISILSPFIVLQPYLGLKLVIRYAKLRFYATISNYRNIV